MSVVQMKRLRLKEVGLLCHLSFSICLGLICVAQVNPELPEMLLPQPSVLDYRHMPPCLASFRFLNCCQG